MMAVTLANKSILIEENILLADVLTKNGYIDLHFAVAINRQFVPRIDYIKTILHEGDVIDIITPMQGG